MINWKFCKKCRQAFDVGTNFDICPLCRRKEAKEKERESEWCLEDLEDD